MVVETQVIVPANVGGGNPVRTIQQSTQASGEGAPSNKNVEIAVIGDANTPANLLGVDAYGQAMVKHTDFVASGTISTQNLNPNSGAATTNSAVMVGPLDGKSALAIQATTAGTLWSGALSVQVSIDAVNWITLGATSIQNVATAGLSATIPASTAGIFQVNVAGAQYARVSANAPGANSSVVTIRASLGFGMVAIDAPLPVGTNSIGVVDTELPAAAALADTTANPTIPAVATMPHVYNGVSWDRQRGNFNTVTSDTGTKTTVGTTFGVTQTNYSNHGVYLLFNIGTVSGTTPTLVFKVQGSPDGGTTWFDIPGATSGTATITATGTYMGCIFPGATAVANVASGWVCNLPLPRTWRVAWTIGGTTPSFIFTNIQVASIV